MSEPLGILNLAIGLSGLMLCLLGILQGLAGTRADKRTVRYFILSYSTLFIFAGANLAGQLMRGHPGSGFRIALYLSNFFEFLAPALLTYIETSYLLSIIDPQEDRVVMRSLFLALTVGQTILLIVSQFTGFIYVIDENNVYHRSGAYALAYVLPLVMIGTDAYLLLCDRKNLTKKETVAFTLYLVIPVVSMIIQVFVYGVYFIVFAAIIAALVKFIFIISDQTERYYRQVEENYNLQTEIMLSQIRPHFIFNTLGAIRRLCRSDSEAREAIGKFALYLRGNMDSLSLREPVAFTTELEHTKAYLDLEQLRFGDELTVVYDLETTGFLLPTLTLQPLVENAVRHGVRAKVSGTGTVTIATRETPDCYEISVSDDGPGFDPEAKPDDGRSHIGLENVRERVRRLCGGELRIESVPEQGSRVTILLPKERDHADIRH